MARIITSARLKFPHSYLELSVLIPISVANYKVVLDKSIELNQLLASFSPWKCITSEALDRINIRILPAN